MKWKEDFCLWEIKELGLDGTGMTEDRMLFAEAIAEASGFEYKGTSVEDFVPQPPHRLLSGDPVKNTIYGDPPIKTIKDAEKLRPADPYKHGRLPIFLETMKLANRKLEGKLTLGGTCLSPLWSTACDLMGMTQAFMAMEKDLELWNKVLDVVIQTHYDFAVAQIKLGAEDLTSVTQLPHWVGSKKYLSNPVWMHAEHPPELFEKIYKEYGVGTVQHACTVGPFLQGIEAFKTWLDYTPAFMCPEGGGADAMVIAKKELAPAVVSGNVPPIDVMLHGTPADVEECCIELIQKCAPGGRFILSPGCEVPEGTSQENVQAMLNAAKTYGRYPIKI